MAPIKIQHLYFTYDYSFQRKVLRKRSVPLIKYSSVHKSILRMFLIGKFLFLGPTASSGSESPQYRGFTITPNDTHSVGLLRTSDQTITETST